MTKVGKTYDKGNFLSFLDWFDEHPAQGKAKEQSESDFLSAKGRLAESNGALFNPSFLRPEELRLGAVVQNMTSRTQRKDGW